jgi:hypothetical protein
MPHNLSFVVNMCAGCLHSELEFSLYKNFWIFLKIIGKNSFPFNLHLNFNRNFSFQLTFLGFGKETCNFFIEKDKKSNCLKIIFPILYNFVTGIC